MGVSCIICDWIWENPTYCIFHQNWDFGIFCIYNVWITSVFKYWASTILPSVSYSTLCSHYYASIEGGKLAGAHSKYVFFTVTPRWWGPISPKQLCLLWQSCPGLPFFDTAHTNVPLFLRISRKAHVIKLPSCWICWVWKKAHHKGPYFCCGSLSTTGGRQPRDASAAGARHYTGKAAAGGLGGIGAGYYAAVRQDLQRRRILGGGGSGGMPSQEILVFGLTTWTHNYAPRKF